MLGIFVPSLDSLFKVVWLSLVVALLMPDLPFKEY